MNGIIKKVTIILVAAALTAAMSITAFAYGWGSDANGSFYYSDKDNTTKYTNGWYWVPFTNYGDAYYYYFDENGYILKDTIQDGMTINADGRWAIDSSVQIRIIQLPDDYYDIPDTVTGLNNSSLAGNYYWTNYYTGKISKKDYINVIVEDEDTIILTKVSSGADNHPPVEAKKASNNVYLENTDRRSYYEYVFVDENTLEIYEASTHGYNEEATTTHDGPTTYKRQDQ